VSHAALGLAKLAGVLNRDLQRVARAAGGPDELWALPPRALGKMLALSGGQRRAADAVRGSFDPAAELAGLSARGIAFIPGSGLPLRLREIFDPPFGLFVAGNPAARALDEEQPTVAVVGARRSTAGGADFARRLGSGLADRGARVISGLAHGIDAAAHAGALDADGHTLAVLACGVDVVYPKRNRSLAQRVCVSGGLVSEYWLGTAPAPWRFPARNRIVSGLAHATVVVEAGERSGALITADFAAEHGRPVLAVPGAPWAAQSAGCNALLRAGAALCESVDDVVDELAGLRWRNASPEPALDMSETARGALEELRRDSLTVDQMGQALGLTPAETTATLSELELAGLVVREPGGRYVAAAAVPRTP